MPQPVQEDVSDDISKPSPSESFIVEDGLATPQEDTAAITPLVTPQPPPEHIISELDLSSPQPEPEPFALVLDLPISQDLPFTPGLDLNDAAQDD